MLFQIMKQEEIGGNLMRPYWYTMQFSEAIHLTTILADGGRLRYMSYRISRFYKIRITYRLNTTKTNELLAKDGIL